VASAAPDQFILQSALFQSLCWGSERNTIVYELGERQGRIIAAKSHSPSISCSGWAMQRRFPAFDDTTVLSPKYPVISSASFACLRFWEGIEARNSTHQIQKLTSGYENLGNTALSISAAQRRTIPACTHVTPGPTPRRFRPLDPLMSTLAPISPPRDELAALPVSFSVCGSGDIDFSCPRGRAFDFRASAADPQSSSKDETTVTGVRGSIRVGEYDFDGGSIGGGVS